MEEWMWMGRRDGWDCAKGKEEVEKNQHARNKGTTFFLYFKLS